MQLNFASNEKECEMNQAIRPISGLTIFVSDTLKRKLSIEILLFITNKHLLG